MSDHHIQLGMFIVQALALLGLTVYCIETFRIRKASQAQVGASQKLLQSSLNQIEGMAKPCIAFWAELRDGADVILQMDGAAGNLVARLDGGSYVIHNIGNGVALNLEYYITRNNPEFDAPQNRGPRYIPTIPAAAKVALVETAGYYNAEHEATFEYGSIGSRRYRSTITLNNRVITSFKFEEVTPQ